MSTPDDRSYTPDHEWVLRRGASVRVGITAHAADALGDVVFVDLPELGAEVAAGEACGEIESTKTVSDLFAPMSGLVAAVNVAVVEDPSLVNADPYGAAWLLEIEPSDEPPALLSAAEYDELVR